MLPNPAVQLSCGSNRRFEFQKRSQLFIRVHNEPFSVAAVRVSNEDRALVAIHA